MDLQKLSVSTDDDQSKNGVPVHPDDVRDLHQFVAFAVVYCRRSFEEDCDSAAVRRDPWCRAGLTNQFSDQAAVDERNQLDPPVQQPCRRAIAFCVEPCGRTGQRERRVRERRRGNLDRRVHAGCADVPGECLIRKDGGSVGIASDQGFCERRKAFGFGRCLSDAGSGR
ncbi:hypothetical protein SDC9_120782 [bioreactor metagenome]|uniref:Uncharacterized protein n=1 Tax=bioreactor metagenome TaxID=1076179 RepID=A0A645CA43_9ZZZZ